MTHASPTSLHELARSLAAHVDAGATILTGGARAAALAEALSAVGLTATDAGDGDTRFDTAVILSADAQTPTPAFVCEKILPQLRPGATVLWATAHARSARRLRGLLHLTDTPTTSSLEADVITTHLESFGAQVERLDDVPEPIDPALQTILDAVAAAGGDADSLRRDMSASHHVLRARLPRRRIPRADASQAALRSAVQGAVAAGASIGSRTDEGVATALTTPDGPPRVSVIVPVYNGAALTEKCLYGIAGNTGEEPEAPAYEVIVVDNGSDDWTMYLLHAMEGDLRVLSNDRNLGFARACNQGAAASQAEYLLFLNNDTVPHPQWLAAMVAAIDGDPQVGIVGARLLYPDGTVQHAGLHLVNGIPEHEFRGVAADDPRVLEARDLDMVTGACLLIRRGLFDDLGGFDTKFVNGVEDVDLCLRARERGYRVRYCPEAVVDHHEAQSQGRFDHVQENVQEFLTRWQGRFDENGRLRVDDAQPEAPTSDESHTDIVLSRVAESRQTTEAPTVGVTSAATIFRVNWEGPFFAPSSLAHVNRELALALIDTGRCDLGLVPFESDRFDAEDPRFAALRERMNRPVSDADVHVRHRWPPDLSRVPSGRLALMQPWEFGRVPRAWVEAVAAGVVEQVWAYTRYVRDCYLDSGVDPARVAIVPLGIDADRFRPGLTPHDAVRRSRSFRFLFVGGTLYRKGIDILLQAWRQAFGADEDVALIIKDMGVDTFYRNQTAGAAIRQLQHDSGCAEIQYLTDDLPGADMPRLYAAVDALVHPYRGEGFGLPVAEAMACGLPVVVTRGGACDDFCPEDISYGVAGRKLPVTLDGDQDLVGQAWLLEPDVAALAAQMRAVFEGRQEARRRGAVGSQYVRTNFTWQRSAIAALEAIEILHSGQLDKLNTTVQVGDPVATAAAPAIAVVLLGGSSPSTELLQGLTSGLGKFHRFAVDTSSGHSLGEQLEAIRATCQQQGVELLFVLAPDMWDLTSTTSAGELRLLRQHFGTTQDLGMLTPATADTGEPLLDTDYPEASCILCRLSAMAAIGGFEVSFKSSAVFANAARSLRRKGWRVAAAGDVIIEEAEGVSAHIVPFGDGSLASVEIAAVEAMERGDRRRDAGDVHAAIDFYKQTLDYKGDFVEAILVLADALVEAGDGDGAIEAVGRLIELDPESALSHNSAGLVAARAGNVEVARASFERTVALDPGLVEARVNLGVLEWEQRNLETALVQFREASRLDPFNRELVCNLGLVYDQIDDPEAAVVLYRGYLERHPDDTELVARLARVLLNTGDPAAAREAARTVLQREPGHAEAQALLTEIDQDLGEDEAAQG